MVTALGTAPAVSTQIARVRLRPLPDSASTAVAADEGITRPLIYAGFSQGVAMAYRAAVFAQRPHQGGGLQLAPQKQVIGAGIADRDANARTVDLGGPGPDPVTIRLRDARVTGLLGVEIPRARQAELLTALL